MQFTLTVMLLLVALASPLGVAVAAEPSSDDAAKVVAASHFKKGMGLREKGKLAAAEREFDLAILSYADSANLYLARGEVRHLQKNYPGAIADFDAYLSRVAADSRILFLRGIAKSLLKPEDVAGACSDILEATRLGFSMDGVKGLDTYCKGQPGWHDT